MTLCRLYEQAAKHIYRWKACFLRKQKNKLLSYEIYVFVNVLQLNSTFTAYSRIGLQCS